jgi:hypothetical protein
MAWNTASLPKYSIRSARRGDILCNLRYREDLEWACACWDGALRNEVFIDQQICYHYREGGSRCSGCWIRAKRSVTVSDYG